MRGLVPVAFGAGSLVGVRHKADLKSSKMPLPIVVAKGWPPLNGKESKMAFYENATAVKNTQPGAVQNNP